MDQDPAQTGSRVSGETIDAHPLSAIAAMGAKMAVLSITTTVLVVAVVAEAAGVSQDELAWLLFASVLVTGATTMLHALHYGRIGTGHMLVVSGTGVFIAVAVQALQAGGPGLLATMVAVSALFQLLLSGRLSLLRQVMTAKIAGTLIMLVGVSVVPYILQLINGLPQGESTTGARLCALATIAVIVALTPFAKGPLRQWMPVVGIGTGALVGAFFGLYDADRVAEAAWVGLSRPAWPGLNLDFDGIFWSLLPGFLLATLIISLRGISIAVAVMRLSQPAPKSTDFRLVQNAVTTEGLGNLVAGVAGALPGLAMLSNASFSKTSGIKSRYIGTVAGILVVFLAFSPKALAVVASIPGPVFGAYILLAMGILFLMGARMVAKDGLDRQSGLIVGLSVLAGVVIQFNVVAPGFFATFMGGALNNAMTTGGLCAMALTWAANLTYSRARKLKMTLELAGLGRLQAFLRGFALRCKWNDATANRLEAIGEEVLLTLLKRRDESPDSRHWRMRLLARKVRGGATLEFISVVDAKENLEDQVALLGSQIDADLLEKEVSLRILRHLAASVRHQQFHGADIITVRMEGAKGSAQKPMAQKP